MDPNAAQIFDINEILGGGDTIGCMCGVCVKGREFCSRACVGVCVCACVRVRVLVCMLV